MFVKSMMTSSKQMEMTTGHSIENEESNILISELTILKIIICSIFLVYYIET